MKGLLKFIIAILFGILLISVCLSGCSKQEAVIKQEGPTEEEIQKITAAAPAKATAAPKKERKLLVFSVAYEYKHSSIPYGCTAQEIIGKKSGAFEAVVSNELTMFEPENIQQFDAVFFNNNNREIFLPDPEKFDELSPEEQKSALERDERLKKSLVDFIAGGKGLVVIHAGVACLREWSEFGNIIGARWDNHPWVAGSTVTLKVDDPTHPIVAQAFKEPNFVVTEEVYQVKEPYSRDKLRVLLSIDTSKTTIPVDLIKEIHRDDNDFGISWIKSYGKGRVFYCALGHHHELYWNPVYLQHLLDGIQFVMGDLEGDITPSSKIK